MSSMQNNLAQLSALHSAYQIVKNPYNTGEVVRLSNLVVDLADDDSVRALESEIAKDPVAVETIRERYRIKPLTLKRCSQFAEGTLGRAYHDHMAANSLKPEELPPPEVHDDVTYLQAHFFETHDIWHTVTGFGTNVPDELGLAAFGAAQFPSQFYLFLVAGGILNSIFYEFKDRDVRMDAIVRGWQLGKSAKHLFGVRWDKHWERPLADVRKELGIPAPGLGQTASAA